MQIYNYPQKRRICYENSKYAFDKIFYGHFCPHRKSANFCHPGVIGENQYQWPDHNDFGDGENDDEDDET